MRAGCVRVGAFNAPTTFHPSRSAKANGDHGNRKLRGRGGERSRRVVPLRVQKVVEAGRETYGLMRR